MYISYVFSWLYKIMLLPVPLVLSDDVYYLVTIFDLFMFTVYIAIFIILIRYLITDNLSINIGGYSMNYSSSAYLPSQINSHRNKMRKVKNRIKKEKIEIKKVNKKESK